MMTLRDSDTLNALQKRMGHVFSDPELLRAAVTHSSADADVNYERLEFLGDRVLGLSVAHALFEIFPNEKEGDLARRHAALVSGATLARVAQRLEIGDALCLSSAERLSGGAENENILSDAVEALIGALYLDAGLDVCVGLIRGLWDDILRADIAPPRDPKTALQEWAQGRGLPLPAYTMVGRTGPDHAPTFTVSVEVEGVSPTQADGASRRAAEKIAASLLLEQIEKDFK